jgi:hypothetical protein
MDTSAFLALPASHFSDPPGPGHHEAEHSDSEFAQTDLLGAHVNGATAYHEGERRRREVLEVAEALEERYRVLLPPDRKWQEKKERLKREKASASVSVEPETRKRRRSRVSEYSEEDELNDGSVRASISAPIWQAGQVSDGKSEVDLDARKQERPRKLKLRIPPRQQAPNSTQASPQTANKPPYTLSTNTTISVSGQDGKHYVRAADGRFISKAKRLAVAAGENVFVPSRKRPRTVSLDAMNSPSKHSVSSTEGRGRNRQQCLLLISAMRSSAAPLVRKTQRNVTAFGVRVPPEIEEVRDFEIPEWLHDDNEEADETEDGTGYDDERRYSDDEAHMDQLESHSLSEIDRDEETKEDIPVIATLDD